MVRGKLHLTRTSYSEIGYCTAHKVHKGAQSGIETEVLNVKCEL